MKPLLLLLLLPSLALAQTPKNKPYRLPGVDLKKPIIWDTIAEGPDGTALAFGGQDQTNDDGIGHTRWRDKDGKWTDISAEMWKACGWQKEIQQLGEIRSKYHLRASYLAGKLPNEQQALPVAVAAIEAEFLIHEAKAKEIDRKRATGYEGEQAKHAINLLAKKPDAAKDSVTAHIRHIEILQRNAQHAADMLGAEPPPRALCGLVYEPKSKLFVCFGGDHFDFLMNDTWVFDPAKRTWEQRHPKSAPPARANHTLKANGDGTITLTGGYTYANNTDYMGGQYLDHNDGDWTYDVAANTWVGKVAGVEPNQRVYRKGPFVPAYFLEGEKPDRAAFGKWLDEVPANTWKKTNPPKLPHMQRDWGTAVLDLDHDMILRWSGGHCAHGGTDVLHYHLSTNRWELTHPVEFPLGQLYTNTEYPAGYNFNKRPWITGHTYQSYGYDTASKQMIFVGQQKFAYIYDPMMGDWITRKPKPKGLDYGSCFYTLTLTPTKRGLMCWTQEGKLFVYGAKEGWTEIALTGEKLQGSVVDNSTTIYDTKRDRLLFFRKPYGDKVGYDGKLQEVDFATRKVRTITPPNAASAKDIPYLCQIRYDDANDMLLVGGTLPPSPDGGGVRRTPVFDCAKDEWGSVALTGDDPNGKNGRNVSLGLMYDTKRKQFWAVDTYSQVYVLKFDPKTADYKRLP